MEIRVLPTLTLPLLNRSRCILTTIPAGLIRRDNASVLADRPAAGKLGSTGERHERR
jgi:hypothetical protein